MQEFSDRLRLVTAELGVSDTDVAQMAGLGVSRYAGYVAGESEPDLATLVRLSGVLGITPNDLLLPDGSHHQTSDRGVMEGRILSALRALRIEDLRLVQSQIQNLVRFFRAKTVR
jgi:transcriptional regulator with XRE-family HTH domain